MIGESGDGVVRARRVRQVRTADLDAVVVDIDATGDDTALAVLQAPLHPRPKGERVIYGYELGTAGLGEWVGDRRLRIRVWPAVADATGRIIEDRHREPGADVLTVEIDPVAHAEPLAHLRRNGRLLIAGPEGGPVPLVLDLDTELLADALDDLAR